MAARYLIVSFLQDKAKLRESGHHPLICTPLSTSVIIFSVAISTSPHTT
jgi:hypothetical protein